jgi:hypothetical protein
VSKKMSIFGSSPHYNDGLHDDREGDFSSNRSKDLKTEIA